MRQKRSKNRSKRSRLEESRRRLRTFFEGAPVEKSRQGLPADEILNKAWDLAEDVESFGRKYLSHYMVDQETGEGVEPADFHRELYQFLLAEMRVAVAAPREHAKSTVVAFIFVLYCLCFKLRWFILLISDTETQAILLLNAVKEELETNDKLRADFGDLVHDRKWGERDIVTNTGIRLSARGAGQSLRGLRHRFRRPDLVICDDLENEEAVDSPERREKLERWFVGTVLNLGKKCQVVVIGTILHYDSLLAKLVDAEKFEVFVKRIYVAVDDDWNPDSVLWPAKWPAEALREKEREIGSVMFDQEFRNRPINQATQVFREAWVREHAYSRAELRNLVLMKISGHDPAISKKQKADFFGSASIGIDSKDGTIYVLRGEQRKMPFNDQVNFIFDKAEQEEPVAIGIEVVAYQQALKQEVDRRGREEHRYLPVYGVEAKGDKFTRISTLSPLVENGTLRFCLDGTQDTLLKQLYFLGKTKDDIADALEIAVRLARQRMLVAVLMSVDPPAREAVRPQRGLMTRWARQQAGREQPETETEPVMARPERPTVWERRWL